MSYSEWAVRIVRHFFGPQFANQRVRLMVTRGLLDQHFPDLGGTNGFIDSLRTGPEWHISRNNTMRQRGLKLYSDWKYPPHFRSKSYPKELVESENAPPFVPYLCLLCLAWTEGDETLAANAYYARLSRMYPNHELNGALGDWEKLWVGLENWTSSLNHGWGKFVVERLGGWVHVGIPRSQVIFTPAKIERFPELFANCGFEAEAAMSRDAMRNVLLGCDTTATPILGNMVFEEIKNYESALGHSALDALREHLENWDGDSPSRLTSEVSGDTTRVGQALLLGLVPHDDNSRWEAVFVTQCDSRFEGLRFQARGWKLKLIAENFSKIIDEQGSHINASDYFTCWKSGLMLHGKHEALLEGAEIKYKLSGQLIRVFDRWVADTYLVECSHLPQGGCAYVLLHADLLSEWNEWIIKSGLCLQDVTWTGLPVGQRLFCIPDVACLSQELRSHMPGNIGTSARSPRPLRLSSGTRCNTSTARRVYAEYDPPILITQAPADAVLNVSGATVTPLDLGPPSARLGNVIRNYALTIGPNESVVVAQLELNSQRVASLSFGVHREFTTANVQKSVIFFDPLGNCSEEGVSGTTVPHVGATWQYVDGFFETGEPVTPEVFANAAFKLLESLHLHRGRLSFQEYKRRATRLTEIEPWKVSEETRWLVQLGFIEMHADSRGRWSHVQAVPSQIYLSPWLSNGRYQFVLTGATEIARLEKILDVAVGELNCDVCITQTTSKIVPPRIVLLNKEIEAGHQLSAEFQLHWNKWPPAYDLANWAHGLPEWLESITWYPDPGPRPSAEYSPEEFRFIPTNYPAPWHLRRFMDSFTQQQWHCLYRNHLEHSEQHAFVRDYSWAMWKVHMAIAPEDELTNLAYDVAAHRLIVPCHLEFPYLLARALVTCSGLPPETFYNCPAYVEKSAGVILPDAQPYRGLCCAYRAVPRIIAELIANKVSARLIDVKV